jgi:hypothetical protein
MYVLRVLNSSDEWELITFLFSSVQQAMEFFDAELGMFDDYEIVKMENCC